MIKHVWSVLCSRALIDKDSNNISLIEVLEEIQLQVQKSATKDKIAVPFPIQWVTLWAKTEEDEPSHASVKDIVMDPAGKTILVKEYDVDLSKHKRYRLVRNLQGMPASKSGRYSFYTQLKDEKHKRWRIVSEIPIDISITAREGSE